MIWHAAMISAPPETAGAPVLRTEFPLATGHGPVRTAILHLTAFGIVDARLNGQPVSEALLTPGWSSYEWRLRYASIDVTDQLEADNALTLTVGNGWYRGRLGWTGGSHVYGDRIGSSAQLVMEYTDGHVATVVTDTTWRCRAGQVVTDDLYDGQTIDARVCTRGWDRAGLDDSDWQAVEVLPFDSTRLVPHAAPPVVAHHVLPVTRHWTSPSGRLLLDFGQNLVGWVRVRVHGPAGHTIVLRHAEVLERDELGVRPLRSARATDTYTLSGEPDVFEPTFTFHGFRYAEIVGWPGDFDPTSVEAVAIGSRMKRTGAFSSSNPLLDRLHENVVWSQLGNFVDLPMDCPQRDERLGWTGDISLFAPTAAFLFDVDAFLRSWLKDLAVEQQHHDGMVPFVVPDVFKYTDRPGGFERQDTTAVWSDAAVWVPWALWEAYGDPTVLTDQFDSMTAHVRRVRAMLSDSGLWDTGYQFGDWLDPDSPEDEPWAAKADPGVVATACAYHSADLMARTAAVLGRSAEHAEFAALAATVRAAFHRHYITDGVIRSDCATVYALAIVFDLLEPADRQFAGDRLADLVAAAGHRVSTGFAGTPFVTEALTRTGHIESAYALLLQPEPPSWLYPVSMGATTIWERWDSMLPDGSVKGGEMASFNHYSLGAVAAWIHRTVGGLAPLDPGYGRVLVAPRPGGGLTHATTSLQTRHGSVRVAWQLDRAQLRVDVELPAGVTGVLDVDGCEDIELGPGQTTTELAVPSTAAPLAGAR